MTQLMAGKRGLIVGLERCQEKWAPVFRPASRTIKNGDGGEV